MSENKKHILIIDDDADILKILESRLAKFNCVVRTTTTVEAFEKEMAKTLPDLCLIDINLGAEGQGLVLVEKIRAVHLKKPSIIMFSSRSDQQTIAHSIEAGADDYLIKSTNRELFEETVFKYLNPLADVPVKLLYTVPPPDQFMRITFDMTLVEVDEYGVYLTGDKLISKGMMLQLSNKELLEITGRAEYVAVSVNKTWIDPETKRFSAYAEFDVDDEDISKSVRKWLVEHQIANSKP